MAFRNLTWVNMPMLLEAPSNRVHGSPINIGFLGDAGALQPGGAEPV